MSNVVKLPKKEPYKFSKTVTKIVDGVPVECVFIDELPPLERARYFHEADKRANKRNRD